MKPAAYLDAVKAELNLSSDYELAKALELSNAYIPGMYYRSRKIRNDLAFKIAITLKLDPAMVIADLEEQRAKNEKRREFWRSFLSRAAYGVAAIGCTLALILSATFGSAAAVHGGFFRRSLRA